MPWSVEYDPRAVQDLKKLDQTIQRQILDYMEDRVVKAANPRAFGKPLRHSKFGLWRYRVRDFRIICELQEHRLVISWSPLGIADQFTRTDVRQPCPAFLDF